MPPANNSSTRTSDEKLFIPPLLRRLCATVGAKVGAALEETQPRFQALSEADALAAGEELGYHEVVRHLASGERCELFLVADEIRSIHRVARVPRRATIARDRRFALQMTASADLLRDLHSAHLVKIIANGMTSEPVPRPYVIAERLAGRNLAVYLRRHGGLDESLAVEVGVQVAKALSVLHRTGLTNPELHPGAVMLVHIAGDHFVVKLTGVDRVRRMTSALSGETNPDVHDDLRGLGALLIHLLTGAPNTGDSGDGALAQTESCELATLLRRLTSRDIRDRPTSIEEVLQALYSIQASLAEASCVSMLRRRIAPVMGTPRRRSPVPVNSAAEAPSGDSLSFGELSLLMPTLRPVSPLATSGAPRGVRVAAVLLMVCLGSVLGVVATHSCCGETDPGSAEAAQIEPRAEEVEVEIVSRSFVVVPYAAFEPSETSAMRRPMHDGQNPRPLHAKGTRSSSPQRRHAVRTKPCEKSPQTAKPRSSPWTKRGSGA